MISAGSVKRAARCAGADLVGIASTDRFKDYPEDKRPEHLLPGARSVIVIGVRVLLDKITEKEAKELCPPSCQACIRAFSMGGDNQCQNQGK